MAGPKVTIYQVAAHAGVSAATVSRVINGARVSADTERRVRAAMAELNFTPAAPPAACAAGIPRSSP